MDHKVFLKEFDLTDAELLAIKCNDYGEVYYLNLGRFVPGEISSLL